MKCNLLLHCGAHAVNRKVLEAVSTPNPTRSWQPIPHEEFLCRVEDELPRQGLRITQEAHGLTHDGSRYFGLLQVENGSQSADYAWILGVRNSHDKSFPAGIVAGSSVFVCDNMAFSGEIKVARKHTRFILRDLPNLIGDAIRKLVGKWHHQDRRVETYRNTRLLDAQAHDLTIQALDQGAICASRIPVVLNEWREPRHEEFQPRNAWSFFNAFTEHLKGNLPMLPRRTEALYGVCDRFVGLDKELVA